MENKNILKLNEFYSVCSQMILHSGKIIQEIFDPKGTASKTKNGDEPFTEADVKVQTLLVKGLKSIWPSIKIIGEEDEVSETLEFDWSSLRKDLFSEELLTGSPSKEIDLSQAIVWIDPLDGTIEFIKGALDSVTTLVGISVNNESRVGVVGKYFEESEPGKYNWKPKCYLASTDFPHLFSFDYSQDSKFIEQKPIPREGSDKLVLSTTRNHFSADLQTKIDKVKPDEVLRLGGAGNKMLGVILGVADSSFYPKPGMKKWDTCAGEALLRSVGGVVTDGNNEPLKYEEEKSTWLCANGVISSISKEKHDRIIGYLNN